MSLILIEFHVVTYLSTQRMGHAAQSITTIANVYAVGDSRRWGLPAHRLPRQTWLFSGAYA
jgi:hypothetical protein